MSAHVPCLVPFAGAARCCAEVTDPGKWDRNMDTNHVDKSRVPRPHVTEGAEPAPHRSRSDAAIVKVAAGKILKSSHAARCFDDKQDCFGEAVTHKNYKEGEVFVARDRPPKGEPGMRENLAGMVDKVTPRTDGVFSGATRGLRVGQVGPEAAVGGGNANALDAVAGRERKYHADF